VRRNRGLDRELVLKELRAVMPAFTSGAEHYGELDRERLEAWARWAKEFGLLRQEPDVEQAFALD
jgi:hypothetical protein